MKVLLLLLASIPNSLPNSFAASPVASSTEIRAYLFQTLPASMQKLEIGKTTLTQASDLVGKPDLAEGDDYYWEKAGSKYALALTFKADKLQQIYYRYPVGKPNLKDFKKWIPEKQLEQTYQPSQPSEKAARVWKRAGIKLDFNPRTDELEAVVLE